MARKKTPRQKSFRSAKPAAAPTILGHEFDDAYRAGLDRARREDWLRWIVTPADHIAVAHGCYFDAAAGQRIVEFFGRLLTHSKGEWAGQPFVPLDWQRDLVLMPLFGWMRPGGTRRFDRAYIAVPKKNGKSSLMSGLGLYGLVADSEQGAEIYTAATDRDQAAIIFDESARMVSASPDLRQRLVIVPSTKRVLYRAKSSIYRALSSEASTKEGYNAHMVLVDEFHAHKSRELVDTLRYSGSARRQPLMAYITTAGDDVDSACFEEHEYALAVREGRVVDWSHFGLIFAADREDPWDAEATWKKANPSYGITIRADKMASDCAEAKQSPSKRAAFLRYRLNIWVHDNATALIDLDHWRATETANFAEAGRLWFGGLDLSATTDTTSLVLFSPEYETVENEDTGEPVHTLIGGYLKPFIWIPGDTIADREQRERLPYGMWARDGWLRRIEGPVIDEAEIGRQIIDDIAPAHRIAEIAFDRWGARAVSARLSGAGLSMVEFGQGFVSLSAPTKTFIRLASLRTLRHPPSPIFQNQITAAKVVSDDAENIKPSKKRSTGRIDALVAAIMAIARAAENPKPQDSEGQDEPNVFVI